MSGRNATLEVSAMQQVKVVSQAIAVVNPEIFHLLLGMDKFGAEGLLWSPFLLHLFDTRVFVFVSCPCDVEWRPPSVFKMRLGVSSACQLF